MDSYEILKKQYLKIIENQLKIKEPPEVTTTYKRLLGLGIEKKRAKLMLADCLQIEMMTIFKEDKEFDPQRFAKLLNKLPNDPYKD